MKNENVVLIKIALKYNEHIDMIVREMFYKEYIESLGNLDDADSYMSQSENVLWNDKHIKLADPTTYDDAGNIIPLSKRDNFTNPDIRYAIAPLIGFSAIGKTKQAE